MVLQQGDAPGDWDAMNGVDANRLLAELGTCRLQAMSLLKLSEKSKPSADGHWVAQRPCNK